MQKDHPFKNVAVPEGDHWKLAKIAEHEDRSMARQLAVMIREKFDQLGLSYLPTDQKAAPILGKKSKA
jgi:hypothetical protein